MTGPEGPPTVQALLAGFVATVLIAIAVSGVLWDRVDVVALSIGLISVVVVIVSIGVGLLIGDKSWAGSLAVAALILLAVAWALWGRVGVVALAHFIASIGLITVVAVIVSVGMELLIGGKS